MARDTAPMASHGSCASSQNGTLKNLVDAAIRFDFDKVALVATKQDGASKACLPVNDEVLGQKANGVVSHGYEAGLDLAKQ